MYGFVTFYFCNGAEDDVISVSLFGGFFFFFGWRVAGVFFLFLWIFLFLFCCSFFKSGII